MSAQQPLQESAARIVRCPVTITGPALSSGATAIGLKPNMVCGEQCEVQRVAAAMQFRCSRGHVFIARPDDIEETMLNV